MRGHKLWLFLLLVSLIGSPHPVLGKELSMSEMRANLERIEKSIEATQKEMKKVDDVRFLPDLYFTLAEFYLEKARYIYSIKNTENKDKKNADPDFSKAVDAKKKAIETYGKYIELFPTHADQDKALFFQAHEYRELGQTETMVLTYKKLTEKFAKSPFWHESHIVLGDHFFEEMKELDQALFHYLEVTKATVNAFTPLAHYKAGWIYINKEKFPEAFDQYESALKISQKVNLSELPELYRKTDIRENALLAMVWPYSELKDKELIERNLKSISAVAYFRSLSFSYRAYQKVLAKIGQRMTLKEKHTDSFDAHAELLRTSEDLPTRLDAILRLYETFKNHIKAVRQSDIAQEIAKTAILLKQSEDIKKGEKAVNYKNLEIFARDIATHMQQTVNVSKSAEDYRNVIESYRYYLWAFPDHVNAKKIRFNLAESYFNYGAKVEAGMLYEKLSREMEEPKLKKQFLASAFEAYVSVVKTPNRWNRLELVQARSGIRGVGGLILKRYPDTRAKATIMYSVAQTYYDERNFGKAVAEFKSFIQAFPNDPQVSAAANQILDAHNQTDNYDKMIADGNEIANNSSIRNKELKANIKSIIDQAQLRKIQKVTGSSSSKKYADNLVKFAQQDSSNVGESALYEAFITLRSQNDLKAYLPGELILSRYKNSTYGKGVLLTVGQMALATADFERAAKYFELFSSRYPGEAEVPQLLAQAAQLREFMGQFEQAKRDFSATKNSTGVARMDFKTQNWGELARSAMNAAQPFSDYWLGLASFRQGQFDQSIGFLRKAATFSASLFEEQEAVAHASFLIGQIERKKYEAIQIRAGKEGEDVAAKTRALDVLTAQFGDTLAKGSGNWTIASLYTLGIANLEFNAFLQKAPAPPGLEEQQLQQYREALKQKGDEYLNRAKVYFDECAKKAEEFDVFSKYIEGCRSSGRVQVDEPLVVRREGTSEKKSDPQSDAIRSRLLKTPRDLNVFLELAEKLFKDKSIVDALAVLERALEIHPEESRIFSQLGNAYLYLKDDVSAGLNFSLALKQNPTEPVALRGLASLQKKYGFTKKLEQTKKRIDTSDSPKDHLHPASRIF